MPSPDDLTANGLVSLKTEKLLPEDGKPPRRLCFSFNSSVSAGTAVF